MKSDSLAPTQHPQDGHPLLAGCYRPLKLHTSGRRKLHTCGSWRRGGASPLVSSDNQGETVANNQDETGGGGCDLRSRGSDVGPVLSFGGRPSMIVERRSSYIGVFPNEEEH